MIKLIPGLTILVLASLLIGGCTLVKQLNIGVAANQPPVITSLTAEQKTVTRAMTTTIECIASDPDGDELSYTWSPSGGNITGKGSTVTWVAPNTYGTYTITVTVTDGRGGQAIQRIDDIEVTCCL
jgi:hypothetical protein